MKITSLNYEKYVIDFLEGELSSEDHAAFQQYLLQHPEIQAEINDYLTSPPVPAATVVYPHTKQLLRKPTIRIWWLGFLLLGLIALSGVVWSYATSEKATYTPSMAHQDQMMDSEDMTDIAPSVSPAATSSANHQSLKTATAEIHTQSRDEFIHQDIATIKSKPATSSDMTSIDSDQVKLNKKQTYSHAIADIVDHSQSSESTESMTLQANRPLDVSRSDRQQDIATGPSIATLDKPALRSVHSVSTLPSLRKESVNTVMTVTADMIVKEDIPLADYAQVIPEVAETLGKETESTSLKSLLLPRTFRDLDDEIAAPPAEDVKKILKKKNRSKLKSLFLPKALARA